MAPPTSTGTVHGRDRVLQDLLELRSRQDYEPLKLRFALEHLYRVERADTQALDYALQELAVAVIAHLELIRDAYPELGGPPPP